MGFDPYLQSTSFEQRIRSLTGFAQRVRTGYYGQGRQVQAPTVTGAITAVGQTISMAVGDNQTKVLGSDKFLPALQIMIEGYAKDDPPMRKMLPIESDVPELLVDLGYSTSGTLHTQAVGDLTLIAYYYLLQIGEYTVKSKQGNTTQTVQFKHEDVTFFKKTKLGQLRCLPKNAPYELILSADSATLKLDNQKNGWKGVCVHQEINGEAIHCPIRALGRRVVHLRQQGAAKSSFLSTFYHEGKKYDVIGEDVSKALKLAATLLEYPEKRGYTHRINRYALAPMRRCQRSGLVGVFGHPNSEDGAMEGRNLQRVHSGTARMLLRGHDYKHETKVQVRQRTWQCISRRDKQVRSLRL
jgi:hypothetical protein